MILQSIGRLGLACAVLAGFAHDAAAQIEVPEECLRALQTYERSYQIPQGLTTAISLAEAGRPMGPNGRRLPWPWTININGQGRFFDTKEQAVAEARKQLDAGQRSIDVGCMQVNLMHHPDAFADLGSAFDPDSNASYGAKFLSSLREETRSWARAVERYHSADPDRGRGYRFIPAGQ